MRSLINANLNVIVNDRLDRANVVGIDADRSHGLLCSRLYAACAPAAHAMRIGMKQHLPRQQRAHLVGEPAMSTAPCWRPERPISGTLAVVCSP